MAGVSLAGAAVSVGYIGVMVVESLVCGYCIFAHVSHLAFVAMAVPRALRTGRGFGPPGRGWQVEVGLGAFALISVVLGITDERGRAAGRAGAERKLAEATRSIVTASPESAPPAAEGQSPVAAPTKPVFVGRYRTGPEQATVRIVMFTDYQCPDCLKIEDELTALMKSGASISASIKYFPFSSMCNPHSPGNLHANACWAARAAETAGMLRGVAGFWEMHHWLFARQGSFTDSELDQGLAAMGYEPRAFTTVMQGPETLKRVQADIKEGSELGLFQTPMIFINGVELKGWNAPQALTRAVRAVLAAAPPPAGELVDSPPDAAGKYIADWKAQARVEIPASVTQRGLGPENALVSVVLFGDYQEPFTAEADGMLRVFTKGAEPRIRYTFAHFPVNQACNPVAQMTKYPKACLAAQAAEGAELLAGPEAFWEMHNWLMANQAGLSDATLRAGAAGMAFDGSMLMEAMALPEVGERIASDARVAGSLGIASIPLIFINGRLVPRWKAGYENVLPRIILEAAAEGAGKP